MVPAALVFSLVVAAAGPAPAEAAVATPDAGPLLLVDAADDELGFWDEYFPLSLKEDMHPSSDGLIVPYWLMQGLLPMLLPWLWVPYMMADVKPGDGYAWNATKVFVVHTCASMALLPILCTLPCVPFFVVAMIAAGIFNIVNFWYLLPVAILNTYDRSIAGKASAPGEPGEAPRQRPAGPAEDEGDPDGPREDRIERRPVREPAAWAPRPGRAPATAMAF